MTRATLLAVSFALLSATACSAPKDAADAPASAAPNAASATTQPEAPAAGGQTIVIEMLTDDAGNNVFRPAEFTVKKGDLVKFTLVGGVHNVHFVADSNKVAGATMPAAGPMLQLPGTSTNILVDFPAGTYYYQCDPHALLGMVGRMTVAP